jgi:hypothetical protein
VSSGRTQTGRRLGRWRQDLGATFARGCAALLCLLFLLALSAAPVRYQAGARAVVLLAAVLAWAVTIAQKPFSPAGAAVLATVEEQTRMGVWELALLGFTVLVAIAYFAVAARIDWITYADGAYYYGVARHIALTGRFEEPILWHFLRLPDRIVHAPFDYWGCMTSLVLVPPMAVFGATLRTAILTTAAVSALTVVAFWYLICFALPLRYRVTQLLSLVIFAFSPAMDRYRFQPESIAVAQLFIVLTLVAFCRRRFVLALLSGFCILLTRGDGGILFFLIFLAVLVQAASGDAGSWRRAWRLGLVGLACVATYMLWSIASFGTLTPPATRLVPFLPSYWQVFDFTTPDLRSWRQVHDWFTYRYLADRASLALTALRDVPFAPPGWWLALMIGGLEMFRRPTSAQAFVWLLCVVGYGLVAWISGSGFAPVRTPYPFTPLVVLAGGLGIDLMLTGLHQWTTRGRHVAAKGVAIGAAVLAWSGLLIGTLPVLQTFPQGTNMPRQADLTKLEPVLHGEPVASNVPWYMIAYTRSPTVSIPFNGEAAIVAALERYPVRWMVIPSFSRSGGRSRPLLDRIVSAERTELGRFRLERVPVAGVKAAVFRVSSTS